LQLHGETNALIVDFGGGKFDVSIVTIEDGKYEVKATAGNTRLGGLDFDNKMVNHFVQKFKRKHQKDLTTNKRAVTKLRTACERAKRVLSSANQTTIEIDPLFEDIDFYTSINRDTFEELNAELFDSIMKPVEDCLREAKMDNKQIHDIVLVGGSTRIPKVQKLLQDFFNGKELNKTVNRDEAVAYGAAVQAAILDGDMSEELYGLVVRDVIPLSLGIERAEKEMPLLINRNTTIPTEQTFTYTTECDNQENVSFGVYEVEQVMTKNKISLGKLELTGIPPAPSGETQIELTFHIDDNGILNVTAVENSTGKENKITVINDNGRLSNEEIESMVKDAEEYRAEDEKQKQRNSAQNALESCCLKMESSVEDETLKDKISESDKNIILDKCNTVFLWLYANKRAEKEEFEFQQKELESVCNQIMSKMYKCAGDMQVGMSGEMPGTEDPASDGGEAPGTEHLQSDAFGQPSSSERHKEFSDTSNDETAENRGKQSYITHVRNIAFSWGLELGV
jgi:L1 cell adhesion molecule like protein